MEDFLLEYKARKMKESTLKQYKNDCRIILLFVLDNCGNRPLTELRKKDFRNLNHKQERCILLQNQDFHDINQSSPVRLNHL